MSDTVKEARHEIQPILDDVMQCCHFGCYGHQEMPLRSYHTCVKSFEYSEQLDTAIYSYSIVDLSSSFPLNNASFRECMYELLQAAVSTLHWIFVGFGIAYGKTLRSYAKVFCHSSWSNLLSFSSFALFFCSSDSNVFRIKPAASFCRSSSLSLLGFPVEK